LRKRETFAVGDLIDWALWQKEVGLSGYQRMLGPGPFRVERVIRALLPTIGHSQLLIISIPLDGHIPRDQDRHETRFSGLLFTHYEDDHSDLAAS
jgi:hypothetical protein